MNKSAADADDIVGLKILDSQEEDAGVRRALEDRQHPEVRIVSQNPARLTTGDLQEFVVALTVPPLFLGVEHIEALVSKKRDNLGRHVLVREDSQFPKPHWAASNSRYTSFLKEWAAYLRQA